jgi:serine/threonine-protein kinase HipA
VSRRATELSVSLGRTPVGTLRLLKDERSEFFLLDSYRDHPERPVLSQFFEDDLSRRYVSRMRLTPFFSNLLPEGALRDLLASKAKVHPEREFFLIQELEEDLPGAIMIAPLGDDIEPEPLFVESEKASALEYGLRFSLAGVQLKFSMILSGRGLTLPMRGEDGQYWIAKLPDSRFPGVPENEYTVMQWAKAAGIDVPETRLYDVADLRNLPSEVQGLVGKAFAIRRFDRDNSGRIHIEDFAQVLGRYAHQKHEGASYENIAQLLYSLDGERALREFIRRLVFIGLVGNADAHLKNWSLIYRNGQTAELSPAYDLVSVVAFLADQELGLSIGGSKKFSKMSIKSFRGLAKSIFVDENLIVRAVLEARDRTLDVLASAAQPDDARTLARRLQKDHLPQIPLFYGK